MAHSRFDSTSKLEVENGFLKKILFFTFCPTLEALNWLLMRADSMYRSYVTSIWHQMMRSSIGPSIVSFQDGRHGSKMAAMAPRWPPWLQDGRHDSKMAATTSGDPVASSGG